MPRSTDIVGYTFKAEVFCPSCIVKVLPNDPRFNGWADCSIPPMSTEANLDEVAAAFGVDRINESSFNSDDFPKVVFRDQVDDDFYMCGNCEEEI